MTDDSLEVLWRGSDPAKFTALQAALRDEGIRFWETMAHDHTGGLLNMRPYYLEAVAGFEIRVYSSDLLAARDILESIENRAAATASHASSRRGLEDASEAVPMLPFDWDPGEATSEIWSGEDESMAEYIASALAENGVPCRIPDEPGHRFRLYVCPGDVTRAKQIVREVAEGKLPE
jgi:hypothetical protein